MESIFYKDLYFFKAVLSIYIFLFFFFPPFLQNNYDEQYTECYIYTPLFFIFFFGDINFLYVLLTIIYLL